MLTVANIIYDDVFKYLMEDKFFSAIENRDTALMLNEKKLAQQKKQLEEQKEQLAEKDKALIASAKLMLTNGVPMEKVVEITGLDATLLN